MAFLVKVRRLSGLWPEDAQDLRSVHGADLAGGIHVQTLSQGKGSNTQGKQIHSQT